MKKFMYKVSKSPRIATIENKFGRPIKQLLHEWHWKNNFMHKEIAANLGVPRPTITRWFKHFDVSSQSCTRFTNLNLLNVGLRKTLPAKPKIKKERPWKLKEKFFHDWGPELAYFLGFFCADGAMYINPRGSHYISIEITDKDLFIRLSDLLSSGHKRSERKPPPETNHKTRWRIQLGSKNIFNHLVSLGITPKKSYRIRMPKMPSEYVADFVRGYFDGDGGVYLGYTHKKDRKIPIKILQTTFTSCSKGMLADIACALNKSAGTKLAMLHSSGNAYRLNYATSDSRKIYKFMYNDNTDLYLERKKIIFEKYLT